MDVHDKKTRSYNMSQIRSRDTHPEIVVRKLCHSIGLRYRLHHQKLPAKPDLTFKKYNTVLLVHGCFWHSHNCKYGRVIPKTNRDFWKKKRADTKKRDQKNIEQLEKLGWQVLTVWECETKNDELLRSIITPHFNK